MKPQTKFKLKSAHDIVSLYDEQSKDFIDDLHLEIESYMIQGNNFAICDYFGKIYLSDGDETYKLVSNPFQKRKKTMISNKELKVLAIETLHPISNIAMVSIDEIWKIEGKHYRELTVWEKGGSVSDEIIASIKVDDSFNSDQVKYLLLAEVDYLEEYFLNQNK